MKYFRAFLLISPWVMVGINIGLILGKHRPINSSLTSSIIFGAAFAIFGTIGFVLNEMRD